VSAWPAIVLGAGAMLGALGAHAETRYVADQASIAMSASPDGAGERTGEIASGEQVEVLERLEDRVHIRLDSGREGWVKASDLTADPPLRLQLAARTHELEERTHQLDQARQQLAVLQAQLERARAARSPAERARRRGRGDTRGRARSRARAQWRLVVRGTERVAARGTLELAAARRHARAHRRCGARLAAARSAHPQALWWTQDLLKSVAKRRQSPGD
jgi:hypothetical protein